jgi:beta-glucosidase-like glycosyl hydrolase
LALGDSVSAGKITVDSLLEMLTLRQRVGQVIMPWLLGNYASTTSSEFDTISMWLDSLGIGGILISLGTPLDVAAKLNALQRRSRVPLLVAADLEWGTAMRLAGGTEFPHAMALGATNRELDAYELGRVTALEARAVGIHLTFSPVADVNNNPANPIINTRSFGEDPAAVAQLVAAYVRGAEEHGLRTTVKHFPGHGDTGTDSHIDLPVAGACWDRLDTLELVPFRAALAAGVTAVMTAHVAVPCVLARENMPATLAAPITTGILRDSLGHDGLIVTDALSMGALLRRFGPGEMAVRAIEAGNDLLVDPTDVRGTVRAVVTAVERGRISRERLDASVRRVLTLKAEAGLLAHREVPLERVQSVVGHADFQAHADDIAARALTLVERGPLADFRGRRGRTAVITYAAETNLSVGNTLLRELRLAGDTVSSFRLYPASGTLSYDSARALIQRTPRVLFAIQVRFIAGLGHISMPDSLARLIQETVRRRPTMLVSFGSPYLLRQIPEYAGGYLLAWSQAAATERAAARALAGRAAITGRLPITLSERYRRGDGIAVK